MSEKIYELWFVNKLTPAYYALSKEDQDNLFAQGGDPATNSNGKILFGAASFWASEQFFAFGASEYPSIDALMKHKAQQEKVNWWRYMHAFTIIGNLATQMDGTKFAIPDLTLTKSMIIKAYVIKNLSEAFYQLSTAKQVELMASSPASLSAVGGKTLLSCTGRWSDESVTGFGVEVYPSLEAVKRHAETLDNLHWFQYGDSFSVLGQLM